MSSENEQIDQFRIDYAKDFLIMTRNFNETSNCRSSGKAGLVSTQIRNLNLSLLDLVGNDYLAAVCTARAAIEGSNLGRLQDIAAEKIEFYPPAFARRQEELLPLVGTRLSGGLSNSAKGAGSAGVKEASRTSSAPLTGLGMFRVGEDGRLYLASKSEHYHLSLGHSFPGYRLLENARRLGIPNATHNNTRGHITRLLEERLVAAANGVDPADSAGLQRVISSTEPHVINRVINLETGSLVVEAALKMVLSLFYHFDSNSPRPRYEGRAPVILVIGDYEGGTGANYHGTTTLTQVMRGLWPGLGEKLESSGAMIVRPVRINDIADFEAVLSQWDTGRFKVAAFFHEIVLMNYGAILLEKDYLRKAYALCRSHDVAVVADEIQSCAWSADLFLFREYGLTPDFVSAGKGFPGGEYPAARILCSSTMDTLQQFGALVTNGQEEIASLASLITIAFVRANGDFVSATGSYYEQELRRLASRHPKTLEKFEGLRHLGSLFFRDTAKLGRFVSLLVDNGIDISIQSYKAESPPSCLTKLPLIATPATVDFIVARMEAALAGL
jgi:acetylornithine/succinyldiaminopimelate/putrescine aminotransferase